jgi:hypothetical protein
MGNQNQIPKGPSKIEISKFSGSLGIKIKFPKALKKLKNQNFLGL